MRVVAGDRGRGAARRALGGSALGAMLAVAGLAGCTTVFDLAAGAQRNDCNRLPDARAQADCRERVDRTTDAARAERERAK